MVSQWLEPNFYAFLGIELLCLVRCKGDSLGALGLTPSTASIYGTCSVDNEQFGYIRSSSNSWRNISGCRRMISNGALGWLWLTSRWRL
ncbi:hypothetical protein B0H11DRAFT_2004803 [Mycena galericulata]|nr:hypothetical protein B0H11DRAFT_2004803 [Mycena galericulata]